MFDPTSDIPGTATVSFDRLHTFHGGLKLPGHREITSATEIMQAGIPEQLILPLQQHIGEAAECLVTPGEHVFKGQLIAQSVGMVSAAVHASSSGTVAAVEDHPVSHPSGLHSRCIIIETDGKDDWQAPLQVDRNYQDKDPAALAEMIRQAGIIGLGGAGFPTQVKLARREGIDLLIINGVECEPYISCDDRLLQEQATEVLEGIRILCHIMQPSACVLAIEDNMPVAEQALRAALDASNETAITLITLPAIYPTGGERQLIKVLTGFEIPSQGYPADIGIICQNAGTAAAVFNRVIKGQPLISRITTVTGNGVKKPGNFETLIGTPISHLVNAAGGYTKDVERLLIGGPMMGYAIHTDTLPVIKTTNCVLAVTQTEMPAPAPAQPCIRCGKCTDVCPADLLPQQLYWYARSGNHDAAQDYNLFDCIECGCCAYVCPSQLPLVQYYRHAKSEIWARDKQTLTSDIARQRHEARLQRLERIKQERDERMALKKRSLSKDGGSAAARQAAIQAAVDRVKKKKTQAGMTTKNIDNLTDGQRLLIDQVDSRRRKQSADRNDLED